MSYHIYSTEGIILKKSNFGEANILLHILTNDLGLIICSAKSARLNTSKLKPGLQLYGIGNFSCIKTKGGWKVTNVDSIKSLYFDYPKYSHKTISGVTSIILKMIQGEYPDKELFKIIKNGFVYLKDIPIDKLQDYESIFILRILKQLGYVNNNDITNEFLVDLNSWDISLIEKALLKRKDVIKLINEALRVSHL